MNNEFNTNNCPNIQFHGNPINHCTSCGWSNIITEYHANGFMNALEQEAKVNEICEEAVKIIKRLQAADNALKDMEHFFRIGQHTTVLSLLFIWSQNKDKIAKGETTWEKETKHYAI